MLAAHLTGDIRIGLYPMLPGDRTCWLAADFDGHAAMLDALAYLKAARALGAPAALGGFPFRRRSPRVDLLHRPGAGSHGPAARYWTGGEAITIRGRMDLRCYDRLFPSQDLLIGNGPGNLIAAPLHGKSRKIGTTVFLDIAALEPVEDQWDYLSTLERLTPTQVARSPNSCVNQPSEQALSRHDLPDRPGPSHARHRSCTSRWTEASGSQAQS